MKKMHNRRNLRLHKETISTLHEIPLLVPGDVRGGLKPVYTEDDAEACASRACNSVWSCMTTNP